VWRELLLSLRAQRSHGTFTKPELGSWILVLGAPWIAPGMADAVRLLKERDGVRIALLIHDLLPTTSQRWFADAQGQAAKRDVEYAYYRSRHDLHRLGRGCR